MVGFILPPAWFLASFLPLPPRPEISSVKGQNNGRQAQVVEDIEKRLGPIDEARYENARWWRNINRIMSLIGIVIVVAVVSYISFDFCGDMLINARLLLLLLPPNDSVDAVTTPFL